jgi:ABC-2 type transport system permease protein
MTTHALADSTVLLRRSVRRMRRYPSMTLFVVALPVVLMLLFVFVFGGTMGAGLGGPAGADVGRDVYLAYVVPGILLLTIAGVGQGIAISVSMDMTQGIIARLRTMAIGRGSVLAGHVLGAILQALIAIALVLAVAVLLGFRPTTGPLAWAGAVGLLVAASLAVCWLSVALGMSADSVETASNSPMILTLLVFLSSAFVPPSTMPGPLAWFAEHQPFTPITETVRGLLLGTPIGDSAIIAVAWCVALSAAGYLWALRRYERLPARPGA